MITPIGRACCSDDGDFVGALAKHSPQMVTAGMFKPDASAVSLGFGLKQTAHIAKAPGSHSALPLVKLSRRT
jgi:hypothetical protein